MDLQTFITHEAPKRCEVHPAFGEVALLVLKEEMNGNVNFDNANFKTARDRARLGLPYLPGNGEEYEKCLDVLELAILHHRSEKHDEDHSDRIDILIKKRDYSKSELEVAVAEFWNP